MDNKIEDIKKDKHKKVSFLTWLFIAALRWIQFSDFCVVNRPGSTKFQNLFCEKASVGRFLHRQ